MISTRGTRGFGPLSLASARCGAGLLGFFAAVVMMAIVIALGVGVWANWDKDRSGDGQPDGFTLHVFDPAWWGIARDDIRPVVRRMRDRALTLRSEIWDQGGMLDQAENWLQSSRPGRNIAQDTGLTTAARPQVPTSTQTTSAQRARQAAEDTASKEVSKPPEPIRSNPISDLDSASLEQLEENIMLAGEHFAVGLVAYKEAHPVDDVWTDETQARLVAAQEQFLSVRVLLEDTLPAYSARPEHEEELLHFGWGLLERSKDLLLESP